MALVRLPRAVSLWAPVVLWAAVIFALSSVPNLATDLGVWDTVLRKCAHATEYAILAVLLVRALEREGLALALGVLYACSDELHQAFVRGRHASPIDVAVDTLGLLVGLAVWRRIRQATYNPADGAEGRRRPPA